MIKLISKKGSFLETKPRYEVMLEDKKVGELYFNMKGYIGSIPTPSNSSMSIGERGIAAYKQEVAYQNKCFKLCKKYGLTVDWSDDGMYIVSHNGEKLVQKETPVDPLKVIQEAVFYISVKLIKDYGLILYPLYTKNDVMQYGVKDDTLVYSYPKEIKEAIKVVANNQYVP